VNESWPGAERRRVPLGSPGYAVREPLARWLESQAREAGAGVRVLDVGCGVKPYYPFFRPYASEYVGVDMVDNPAADLTGPAEALPVSDGSFDVVLATQVIEHCYDPAQAVREFRRVVAKNGRVLASTHGVQVYHPLPDDFWRWTHAGLARLFELNGEWRSLSVEPGSGTAACVGMLVSIYTDVALRRAGLGVASGAATSAINRAARALDRRSAMLREMRPGSLFANYHVVARA
jgi:SAM-dependent methyltransferase